MRLTKTTIAALTLPEGVRDRVYFDEELAGFGVRLRASGARSWHVQYAIGGRTRRMSIGSLATLDAADARETAKDILARVRLGQDPASDKQAARARVADTVGALLPRFLSRQRARIKPRSLIETRRHLEKHAKPLHALPITKLDRRTVAALLSKIATDYGPSASNRVRNSLSAFCTWAAKEGLTDANAVAFTNRAIEGGPRKRLLADEELAAIWSALGDDQYGVILRLLLLLGLRRDEIGSLRWSEVDLDRATIKLPPSRTKNSREFIVPLPEPAVALLKVQPRRTEADGTPRDLIFGAHSASQERGFQNWDKCKKALDEKIAKARSGKPLLGWRLHDFRRVVSTAMHERLGIAPHVVEAVLGHAHGGHQSGVAGTYNVAIYLDERRRALNLWAACLLAAVEHRDAKIVPLRA